jgi:hypothetical protein
MEISMANLDDLGFSSISDKSIDEGLETIRQIHQARLVPSKPQKPAKVSNSTTSKKKEIEMTPEQATRLLKLLTGE